MQSLTGNEAATLFAVLDCTVTAMGSRALRRWLNRPIRAQPLLRRRYHAIARPGRLAPLRSAARAPARRSATWSASWRAWRCARRGRATWCSCAARWPRCRRCVPRWRRSTRRCSRNCAPASASTPASTRCSSGDRRSSRRSCCATAASSRAGYDAELDELRPIAGNTDGFLLELERRERERTRHRQPQARLQPRAGLFHRSRARAGRARACRLPAPPDRQVGRALHHPGAQAASRTRCSARASARWRANASCTRQLLTKLIDGAAGPAAHGGAACPSSMRWRRWPSAPARSAGAEPTLVAEDRLLIEACAPPGGRALPRCPVRAQRSVAAPRAPHADHHRPEHGRQIHLHARRWH